MLEVGNGMTEAQDKAHFTIWCIMASPLIAGNVGLLVPPVFGSFLILSWCCAQDLRTMSESTKSILTNRHAIAVNQDPLGHQATLVAQAGPLDPETGASTIQCYAKRLVHGWAVMLLNRGSTMAKVEREFAKLPGGADNFTVYDLWEDGKSLGKKARSVEGTSVLRFA